MALSTGNKVAWADIQSIYTQLNNCQSKFGITKISAPSNPGVVKPNVVTNLKSFIFALSSSKYVSTSFVSSVFNLANPVAGDLLKADPFNTMKTSLTNVFNVCANDSDFTDYSNDGDFNAFFSCSDQGYTCFGSSDFNEYCNAQF